MTPPSAASARYVPLCEIGAGGMATVHVARLAGPEGFSRLVALKRLHPQYARDPEFVATFIEEARVAGRIQHANVVAVLDCVIDGAEVLLVMDYVPGESLSSLLRRARPMDEPRVPPPIATRITIDVLHGLHAAHEARGPDGDRLEIVHRDVSPQNVLVAVDGLARLLDFGIAKATGRARATRDGQLKGKLAYMAPEQARGGVVDRRTDLFAAGIVLWEMLTGRRLFDGPDEPAIFRAVLDPQVPPARTLVADLPPALDPILARALAIAPEQRYPGALEMARALELSAAPASHREVAAWVRALAGGALHERAALITARERALPEIAAEAPPPAGVLDQARARRSTAFAEADTRQLAAAALASPPPPRRRRRWWALVAFPSLVAAAVLVAVLTRPAAVPPTPKPASIAIEPLPGGPSERPPAAAPDVAPPAAARAAQRQVRRGDRTREPKPTALRKADPCAEKFTVDPQGVFKVKPECVTVK